MHLLLHRSAAVAGGVLHRARVMACCKHHTLLLQVLIALALAQLYDVVLALPA